MGDGLGGEHTQKADLDDEEEENVENMDWDKTQVRVAHPSALLRSPEIIVLIAGCCRTHGRDEDISIPLTNSCFVILALYFHLCSGIAVFY